MSVARDSPERRAFIGVHHTCCNAYSRAYINRKRNAFEGSCPKCGRRVQLRVGHGGSKARFWKTC